FRAPGGDRASPLGRESHSSTESHRREDDAEPHARLAMMGANGPRFSKIRALLVVPWDHERGGGVSVVDNFAKYFEARGHTTLFFHPGATIRLKRRVTKLGFPGVQLRLNMPFGQGRAHPVLRFLAFPFLLVSTMIQLLWLLRKLEINLVNLHYLTDQGLYFAICRYVLPIRLVA